MRIHIRPFALICATVLLAACSESVSGPTLETEATPQRNAIQGADREVTEFLYDMNGTTMTVVCEDGTESETVRVSGFIAERYALTFTPSGMIHYTLMTMPIGLKAVGIESGVEYRIKDSMHGVGRQSTMGANNTFRSTFRLESTETGQRFRFSYSGHYTLNGNGDLVAIRENATAVCER